MPRKVWDEIIYPFPNFRRVHSGIGKYFHPTLVCKRGHRSLCGKVAFFTLIYIRAQKTYLKREVIKFSIFFITLTRCYYFCYSSTWKVMQDCRLQTSAYYTACNYLEHWALRQSDTMGVLVHVLQYFVWCRDGHFFSHQLLLLGTIWKNMAFTCEDNSIEEGTSNSVNMVIKNENKTNTCT